MERTCYPKELRHCIGLVKKIITSSFRVLSSRNSV
uniref:Uncharacterized protein n=1 Tax=Arundo donax TaxID=35708 RepID=A0A0A8ZRA8_ARUDO